MFSFVRESSTFGVLNVAEHSLVPHLHLSFFLSSLFSCSATDSMPGVRKVSVVDGGSNSMQTTVVVFEDLFMLMSVERRFSVRCHGGGRWHC